MIKTQLVLDYACCHCQNFLSVTVQCAGKGVEAGPHAVAGTKIPCPFCEKTNEVIFELSGLVLKVAPEQNLVLLEPSVN